VCVWLRMRTIASVSQSAWTIIYMDYNKDDDGDHDGTDAQ